jgi:hypothetical protein
LTDQKRFPDLQMADQRFDVFALRRHILSLRWILRTPMGSPIKGNGAIPMLYQNFLFSIPGCRGSAISCKKDHGYAVALIHIPQFHTIVRGKELKVHDDFLSLKSHATRIGA